MDSKMRGVVRVELWNPLWREQFREVRVMLSACLGDLAIAIEHVGSTAVEGLAGKPILDIDAVIASRDDLPAVAARLATIGFVHEGDGGIPGREVFRRTFEDAFMAYHLYVCARDAAELQRHLAFRDRLASSPPDRKAYGRLKEALAARYPTDIDAYMAGKDAWIKALLARMEKEDAERGRR